MPSQLESAQGWIAQPPLEGGKSKDFFAHLAAKRHTNTNSRLDVASEVEQYQSDSYCS